MSGTGLWAIAASSPDRPAVFEPGGRVVSYGELAGLADRYGRGLQELGLRPGSCVATLLPNSTAGLAVYSPGCRPGCTWCR
jgi:long-chain acyl-CoA synthetase